MNEAAIRGKTGMAAYWVRTVRLTTGLVMMAFVVTHFANHSLALISLEAAEAARPWMLAPWRNPAGSFLLLVSFVVHIGLALWALYRRRSLVMPWKEASQLVLGLAIPVLLAEHIAGTKLYGALTGIDTNYEFVANSLWIWAPLAGFRQALAVMAVWVHGCLGLYFWLRYRPWFPRAAPFLLVAATLMPVLALLGFVNAGRAVEGIQFAGADGIDPQVIEAALAAKERFVNSVYGIFGGALGLVLVLRVVRAQLQRRHLVEIRYPDGRAIRVPKGHSVLEASRLAGIPHHAVCGGRGRCSTCRVRVLDGLDHLPPIAAAEQGTLTRIHADPDVRLACQVRPRHDIKVIPLLAAGTSGTGTQVANQASPGHEQELVVLFCDIRGFTALTDKRLPFDTVFLLNRYFALVGKAVERSGGRLDKFIGDGAMAIFGLSTSKAEACRQALAAAAMIVEDLSRMSEDLAAELPGPLRIAIGIHAGPAIAGTMGYGRVLGVTAIGDTVNIASRLESVAKELDASIVISAATARLAGADLSDFELRTVSIRGHSELLTVHVVPQQARLPGDSASEVLSA